MKEKTTVLREFTREFGLYKIIIKTTNGLITGATLSKANKHVPLISLSEIGNNVKLQGMERHLDKINVFIKNVEDVIKSFHVLLYFLETYKEKLEKEIENDN